MEKDIVTVPMLHDTPGELAQPFDVKDWKKGECELMPGKTHPNIMVVERDYPEPLQEVHLGRPAAGEDGQRWQGHQLEYR